MSQPVAAEEAAQVGQVGHRRWLALAVVMVGGFMTLMDTTIVNVAIPSIRDSLGAGSNEIEWVVSGYALAYGLTLVLGGRLGDLYGHRRMFGVGLAVFTGASVLCGVSGGAGQLVAWRVVQGVGAGLLFPQISATIQIGFPGPERARAFALFGMTQGFSTVVGPLAGGVLIHADVAGWDWRPIFLVNLPIGVAALAGAALVLPAHRAAAARRPLDLPGAALLTVALLLLLLPLVEGQRLGWPAWTYASLAAAGPALVLFAWWEWNRGRAGRDPLVRLGLFGSASFAGGVSVALVYFASFTSLAFTASLFLQLGQGYDALGTGLALTPFAVGSLLGASQSDRLTGRFGSGAITGAVLAVLVGFVWLELVVRHLGVRVDAWDLAAPLLLAGVGNGVVIPSLIDVTLARVPVREAGSAGGVLATGQRVGTAIGIALIGVVFFTTVDSHLPGQGTRLAYAAAMRHATWVNIALVALALALTWLLPRRARPGQPTPPGQPGQRGQQGQRGQPGHRPSPADQGNR